MAARTQTENKGVETAETETAGDETAGVDAGRRSLCRWCRRIIAQPARGRPREFCKRSCRQRDFEARTQAASHGLDEQQLIITRSELDELRDRIYVLTCAVEDIDNDLGTEWSTATIVEVRDSLGWLIAAARPLATADPLGS